MAERPREQSHSFLLQTCIALLSTALGVYCSSLLFGASNNGGSREQVSSSCDQIAEIFAFPSHTRTFMGTKLPYQFEGVVNNEMHLNNCTADKVYGLYRHGTRSPTISHIKKWAELVRRLKTSRVTSDLGVHLLEWTSVCNEHEAGCVTSHGLMEQYCLATRLKQRYPDLLEEVYSNHYYSFRSSSTSRTVQSGLAFARGLFEDTGPIKGYQPVHMLTLDQDRDMLLRYHDYTCPMYDDQVLRNKTLNDMIASYLATEEVTKVVMRIRDVFSSDWLSVNDIRSLFKLCIHETSLLGHSRWCDLFTERDLLTFAYYSDLRAFWVKGPGLAVTGQRSINTLHEIVSFITAQQGSKVMLRFGHAETLLPLMSLMGVVSNKPHLLDTYMEQRGFETSKLVPFSGNLVAVKYSCTDQEDFVRFLLNEKPVSLSLCNDKELCTLSEFLSSASNLTQNWTTLEQLCTVYS